MNFEELVEYLEEEFDIDLVLNKENAICLKIDNHLILQIEQDIYDNNFIFLAYIYELLPGKFREDVFISALKANNFPAMNGTLGYFREENYLTFHKFIPSDTPKDKIIDNLSEVIYIAENWKKALDRGRTAPDDITPNTKNEISKPFGLRP
jgi:hypothetical protein